MKKEIHPGFTIAALVLVVGVAIGFFVMNSGGATKKVDVYSLDREDLRDPEPVKRGQPGYKERTTDPD